MNAEPSGFAEAVASDAQALVQRELRAQLAAVTGGLAPDVYATAWTDWYLNLSKQPKTQLELMQQAIDKVVDNWTFALRALSGQPAAPKAEDPRFAGEPWQQWPFNLYAHAYQNFASWWQTALSSVPGVAPDHARTLAFAGRSLVEAGSPANYLATNPELLETTRAESGANLVRGLKHFMVDMERLTNGKGPPGIDDFVVGRDVAVTPGKVVMRNRLAELIQYAPTTDSVQAEPILIVPAWIMKYYILDLSPKNSLVRYLVSKGHTVFMLSWRNPDATERDLGMDDYLQMGVYDALDAVSTIVQGQKIHSVGYCIGGTLLSIAAATLGVRGDQRLASLTLLAAQTDFSEPGELSLFISPSQIQMVEAMMQRAGVLKSEQMAAAFQLLRARDLLWMPAVNTYLRGQREKMNDLMAWNADGTRMPCRMHSEYLQQLYLHNALAQGEFYAQGQRVDLGAIHVPMFVVGTETDHVAPWKSVYKVRALTHSPDFTFLLTSGGHNAGIVSGPEHPRRRHRLLHWDNATDAPSADEWLAHAELRPNSWWPTWEQWLTDHSSSGWTAPPLGNADAGYAPIEDAPGQYVRQK
jgi:polyhydroxyalkanoate synthase